MKARAFDPADFVGRNAGIPTGPINGILVVDVDDKAAVERWLQTNGYILPPTRTHKTGSGGEHYLYAYPSDGKDYGNKSLKAAGFDVRGIGGQIVSPGSIHPVTGKIYEVIDDRPVSPAPAWLLALYTPESATAAAAASAPTPAAMETPTTIIITDPASTAEKGPWFDTAEELPVAEDVYSLIVTGAPRGKRSEAMWKVLKTLLLALVSVLNIHHLFEKYAIGEKYREKNDLRQDWLNAEIERARVQDSINLDRAASPHDYDELYFQKFGRRLRLIPWCNQYYMVEVKESRSGEEVKKYRRVSTFILAVDHVNLNNHDIEEPSHTYRVTVRRFDGLCKNFSLSANELVTPEALRRAMTDKGGCSWRGDLPATLEFNELITGCGAPEVRQLTIKGYDPTSEFYVYRHFAIGRNGECIFPDNKGLFYADQAQLVRPAPYTEIMLAANCTSAVDNTCKLLVGAWHIKALVATCWMIAGWFVNQIKAKLGFFPFMSFYGDPSAGKSHFSILLNSLQALEGEGLPMFKTNTAKGELRTIAQHSGHFIGLAEANKNRDVRFDASIILPLYNNNPIQTRAIKSNDIQTQEIPFLGALLFVQNFEPFTTLAQKERVISLEFLKKDINDDTTEAYRTLRNIPSGELAHFFVEIMKHRPSIEEGWLAAYEQAKARLVKLVSARIAENHAIIVAFYEMVRHVIGDYEGFEAYVQLLALEKQKSCRQLGGDMANYFFECLEEVFPDGIGYYTYLKKGNIKEKDVYLLKLPMVVQLMSEQRFNVGAIEQLRAELKTHPAFISDRHSVRAHGLVEKFWAFDIALIDQTDQDSV